MLNCRWGKEPTERWSQRLKNQGFGLRAKYCLFLMCIISWIRNILASWIRIRKNMRIHGSKTHQNPMDPKHCVQYIVVKCVSCHFWRKDRISIWHYKLISRSRDCFTLVPSTPGETAGCGTSPCECCLKLKLEMASNLR